MIDPQIEESIRANERENADHLFHLEQYDTTSALFFNSSYGIPLEGIPNIGPIEHFTFARE